MPFEDYELVAAEEFLALPIAGKVYTIKPVGAKGGARLRLARKSAEESMAKANGDMSKVRLPLTDEETAQILLGDTLQLMRADDVSDKAISRAVLTALIDHWQGRAAAEIAWKTGLSPERLAALAAASGAATPRRTRRAAASTSRSGKSGSTTSGTATKRSPRAARPSAGRRSSSSGD